MYKYKTIQDYMREMARKKVRCVSFSCQFMSATVNPGKEIKREALFTELPSLSLRVG